MTQPDTRSVHAGRDDLRARGLHVPPIDLRTTYPLTDTGPITPVWGRAG